MAEAERGTRVLTHRWVPRGLLLVLPVAFTAVTIVLTVRTGDTISAFTLLPSTATIGVVGALLAGLRPRYAGGWLMLATGIAFLVGQIAEQVAVGAQSDAVATNAAWVATWIFQPALVLLFVLVPLTFPDGRIPSRRWRPLVVVSGVLLVAVMLAGAFLSPTLAPVQGWTAPNPYTIHAPTALAAVPDVLGLATLAAAVLATASLVVRWRLADRVVRRQILWVVLALGVLTLSFAVDAAVAHLAPTAYASVFPLIQLVPIVLPVAVAVAVLRHQLFDIEVLVGRTVVYGALTGACQVPDGRFVADLKAAIGELERRTPNARIGSVGFCFGGGMVWSLLAAGEPRLAAAAPFYGPLPQGADFAGSPNAAVLGVCAEQDERVNASREAATKALQKAGLTYEIVTYPNAGHAFFNDTGPRYNAAAAGAAYQKLTDWFGSHLG